MKKVYDKVFWLFESFCKIAMIIQIISVSLVVFGRQLFSKTPAWGEELTLFCLVWFSLIGAVILLKEDGHIAVTAFDPWLSKKVIMVMDFLAVVFLAFFAIVMLVYGIKLVELTSLNKMAALKIKSSWLYAAVPFSSFAMLFVVVEKLKKLFSKGEQKKEDI